VAAVTRGWTLVNSNTFLEPVWSSLPYVKCRTSEFVGCNTVLMDEEGVVGITQDDGGDVTRIDVLRVV
jgi:hypothetical protein